MDLMASPDTERIRSVYERFAPRYDRCGFAGEALLLRALRRSLIARVRHQHGCRVLEIGIGTGINLPYYDPACVLTGVDLSRAMLEHALARAHRLGRQLAVQVMDAEHLGFEDATFDSVVSTLTLCTTPDPVRALREMGRVCRPGGRVLLLEHGRSSRRPVNWFLDRLAPGHFRRHACHLTRDVAAIPAQAGLHVSRLERHVFGIVVLVEAGAVPA
jgi:ubiquinone/menaquinone biosynthesis C-methylase UbiE